MSRLIAFLSISMICAVGVSSTRCEGQDVLALREPAGVPSRDILTAEEWKRVDRSIERGLEYLISQQRTNGAFRADFKETGQPGVTSLCVMCFLANGYLPGEGKYGEELAKAVKFIVSQQTESGVISVFHPGGPKIHRQFTHQLSKTIAYNHAISSLLLSEIYGMAGDSGGLIDPSVIQRSLDVSLKMHRWPKD